MKKSGLLFLVLAALLTDIGCSSSPRRQDRAALSEMGEGEAEQELAGTPKNEESGSQGANEERNEDPKPTPQPLPASEYKNLSAAVKRQDEGGVVREASKFLARNPNDVVALNSMAVYYINAGKIDLAKVILGKALRVQPDSPTLHNNLGLVYLMENKIFEASVEFRRALEANSNHPEASANLGAIQLKYRNYPAAVPLLEKAYRSLDKDPNVATNFAVALAGVRKYADAEKIYERMDAEDSSNVTILLNYATLLIEHLEEKKDGLKIVNKIRFLSQDSAILRRAQWLADKAEALK